MSASSCSARSRRGSTAAQPASEVAGDAPRLVMPDGGVQSRAGASTPSASSAASSRSSRFARLERVLARHVADARPAARRSVPPPGWRYCRIRQSTRLRRVVERQHHRGARDARRPAGRTARRSARPGGGGSGRARSATTQSSRCRSVVETTGHALGPVGQRRASVTSAPSARARRRRPVSSIGIRSSLCRSIAAPISPANSGCGRVGRERSSGWAWVAT